MMAFEDRNFEILRAQCLNIAADSLIGANVPLESVDGRKRLFDLSYDLLKTAMERKFLEWVAKDYTPKKTAEKPSESFSGDVCSQCGDEVSKNVSDYSKRHYGRPYCLPHQKGVEEIGN